MKLKIFTIIALFSTGILLFSLLESWMYKPSKNDYNTIMQSSGKALALLQRSSYKFINNSRQKCASCHNNTLTAMSEGIAKRKGIPVIDSLSARNVEAMVNDLAIACNPNLINDFLSGANFVIPYVLVGMDAVKYKPDVYTDIAVDYLMSQSKADGSFLTESGRDPLETGDVHLTAMAIRSIQLYASAAKKDKVEKMVAKTRTWLEKYPASQEQDLCFQLLGLHWCGSTGIYKNRIAAKIESMQNMDGGWSQLPTMKSDAYATGQALYALYETGEEKTTGPVYQKGLSYLLKTQKDDGSWFVPTRAYPIQPFVNGEFPPYDDNQFISAAASNWALMALLNALPDKKN